MGRAIPRYINFEHHVRPHAEPTAPQPLALHTKSRSGDTMGPTILRHVHRLKRYRPSRRGERLNIPGIIDQYLAPSNRLNAHMKTMVTQPSHVNYNFIGLFNKICTCNIARIG